MSGATHRLGITKFSANHQDITQIHKQEHLAIDKPLPFRPNVGWLIKMSIVSEIAENSVHAIQALHKKGLCIRRIARFANEPESEPGKAENTRSRKEGELQGLRRVCRGNRQLISLMMSQDKRQAR